MGFDTRGDKLWMNGKIIDWTDANVHVLTHGLHYGSSVFEGTRAYGGKMFKLSEHNERLLKSAKILGFEIPYSLDELNAACEEAVEAEGHPTCYVRPIAWCGSNKMAVDRDGIDVHVAVATWDMGNYFADKMRGLKLCIADWRRPDPVTAPHDAKAAGLYMICSMSKSAAQAKGCDDALMLDWRGQVAEGTGANIFFIRDGAIHTPTPDCFLDGITRRTVIGLARDKGLEVIERAIMPEELPTFSEVFFTGTAAEVTPVRQIEDIQYQVGQITHGLAEDYDRLVNGK